MVRPFKPCVLTANDLLEGDVVYLGAEGTWTRRFDSARLIKDESEARRCLAVAEAQADIVIEPYLANASPDGRQGLQPLHFREAFRAAGPSNYHHGKQAEG